MYPASQSPNAKPTLNSTYFLVLTPDQVDYVAPANQVFSICLFLVRYFLSSESFLASDPIFSSSSGDWLRHDIVSVTDIVFLNHPLTEQLGGGALQVVVGGAPAASLTAVVTIMMDDIIEEQFVVLQLEKFSLSRLMWSWR